MSCLCVVVWCPLLGHVLCALRLIDTDGGIREDKLNRLSGQSKSAARDLELHDSCLRQLRSVRQLVPELQLLRADFAHLVCELSFLHY